MLLSTLQHPQVTLYLHLDRRTDSRPFRAALAAAALEEPTWLRRYATNWGSLAIVDAEIEGISRALADDCSYVLLISGEDFPLRPIEEILAFTEANRDRSFVETFALAEGKWPRQGRERTDFYTVRLVDRLFTCVPLGEDVTDLKLSRRVLNWGLRARFIGKPLRRFPAQLAPHGGSQWLNLTAEAAAFVVDFTQRHPEYRDYHRYTACPDELFVQSILLGSGFADANEIVNDDLRFLAWQYGDHPRTLGIGDLPGMVAGSDLFARKIRAEQDPQLFAELRSRVSSVTRA